MKLFEFNQPEGSLMKQKDFNKLLQKAINEAEGRKIFQLSGVFGPATEKASDRFDVTVTVKPKAVQPKPAPTPSPSPGGRRPDQWKSVIIEGREMHPIFAVPAPYTHLHPIDLLRSVAGEKEIGGKVDNALIAHFHEHSPNLAKEETGGPEDAKNHYSDEVPHCMSAQNWAQDGCGCHKSRTALAASGQEYAKLYGSRAYKIGDMIPEGALICIDGHITRANKPFKWTGKGTFEGFGSNQGNTIKTSVYNQSRIKTICDDAPKSGTVLAPIGILGNKPVPATGSVGESTR